MKDLHNFGMEDGVRANDRSRPDGVVAFPVGNDAAGSPDDGDVPDEVPLLDDRVGHNLGPSAGHHKVAVGIAPASKKAALAGELRKGGIGFELSGPTRIGGKEEGSVEGVDSGAAHRFPVQGRPFCRSDHQFAKKGLMDSTEHRLALVFKGNEGPEKRNPVSKAEGAVDGIEDPNEVGVGIFLTVFFTDNPVIGIGVVDKAANDLLGAPVRLGDGGIIPFEDDLKGFVPEKRIDHCLTFPHEHFYELTKRVQVHGLQLWCYPEDCQGKKRPPFVPPMEKTPLHILDFEGNTRCGIVEYGVVTLVAGRIVDVQTRLCRGDGPIDPVDSRLHGIRNRDLLDHEPVESDWLFFSGLRRTGPLGAHHAPVEDSLIRKVWPYPGPVPDFLNGGEMLNDWGPWIDTRRLYAHLFPDLDSHQLMDLVRLFHLEEELSGLAGEYCPETRRKHHCALHDALASALLLKQVYRLPGYETVDLWWLLFNSAAKRSTREDWLQGELF